MDEQERIKVHDALDRILDFAKERANQDDRHIRWKLTLEAIYSLNTILGGAEPVLRELWKGVPENSEAASATRWPVIHVLTKFQPLLPPEVWQKFVLDLIGLEDGQRSEIFEPKRPLKRKGWVARSNFSQSMGSLRQETE